MEAREVYKIKVMGKVLSPGQIGMELDNSMLMEE